MLLGTRSCCLKNVAETEEKSWRALHGQPNKCCAGQEILLILRCKRLNLFYFPLRQQLLLRQLMGDGLRIQLQVELAQVEQYDLGTQDVLLSLSQLLIFVGIQEN